ncbi:methyltransferase domain-containing protein [Gemmatimonadota bacterium]
MVSSCKDVQVGCEFCDEILSGRIPEPYVHSLPSDIRCRVLIETPQFIVVPALGPLALGHLLIIPKAHLLSISRLSLEHRLELITLMRQCRQVLRSTYGDIVVFEHGPKEEDQAGGICIAHAHVHIMPYEGEAQRILREDLEETELYGLTELIENPPDEDYVYFEGSDGLSFKYAADFSVPSQYVRQVICEDLGNPDWDWRETPSMEMVVVTYRDLIGKFTRIGEAFEATKIVYDIGQQAYDAIAAIYHAKSGEGRKNDSTLARFRDLIATATASDARVLDVGCGTGHDLAVFRERGFKTIGIDLSIKMLKTAKGQIEQGLQVVQGNVRHMPIATRTCDVVWCVWVLNHFPDDELEQTICEMLRIAKVGAFVVFAFYCGEMTEIIRDTRYGSIEKFYSFRDPLTVRAALIRNGAKVLKEEQVTIEGRFPCHGSTTAAWVLAKKVS